MARTVPGEDPRTIKYPFVRNYEPFKKGQIVISTEGKDDEEGCIQRVSYNRKILLRLTVVQMSSWYGRSGRYQGSSNKGKWQDEYRYEANGDSEGMGEDAVSDDDEIK
jgi:hypothetical protein